MESVIRRAPQAPFIHDMREGPVTTDRRIHIFSVVMKLERRTLASGRAVNVSGSLSPVSRRLDIGKKIAMIVFKRNPSCSPNCRIF